MEPRKVMVVDDEPDTVTFLLAWLEDMGYAACCERDAWRVVESARRERPHAVLLDVNMPGRSGIHVYRQLRETEGLRDVPVIFISGASDFELFGNDCTPLPEPVARLEKPIDLGVLGRTLTEALDGAEP